MTEMTPKGEYSLTVLYIKYFYKTFPWNTFKNLTNYKKNSSTTKNKSFLIPTDSSIFEILEWFIKTYKNFDPTEKNNNIWDFAEKVV